ncbi:hypothetical protein C8046_10720 [Serinibacter arcticus]|uniref:Uncharacterized protein n=1 Tax=Serinibacter arcticus TaxID=1655435 RepID=A0A2U1ZVQ6_9MICO|nr:hypothetical protein [Serinibacter arcticus]PWD51051.1 hypothetical protein C8046_10720 [Serinibacter arcticus]
MTQAQARTAVRRRPCTTAALTTLAALLFGNAAACAPAPRDPPAAPSAATETAADPAATVLADALVVEIEQARLDWGRRVVSLVISVPDDAPGDAPDTELEVVAANLDSPAWDGNRSEDPDRTVTVAAGRTRSMFVALGDPQCAPAPDGTPEALAVLTVRTPDGEELTREVAVTDPYGHLARAWGEDCARAGAEEVASLAIGEEVVAGEHDGVTTGTITVTVTPEATTDVVLTGITGTQLLAPLGGAAAWTDPSLGSAARTGSEVPLTFTAVRCDRHAIAEDKRGTYLGITTTRDGVAQPVFHVQLPERTRANLMEWFAQACAWE